MTEKPQLLIDFVADLVCPWCHIGLRSLRTASETLSAGHQVLVRYRAYQLNRDTPIAGVDREAYYAAKFPVPERRTKMRDQLVEAAGMAGFDFDPGVPKRLPNTLLAHVAMRRAHFDRMEDDFALALYTSYWDDGADIGDPSVLASIAARVGMDRKAMIDTLADNEYRKLVAGEADAMRAGGVSSVPTFIVNEGRGFSGALPPKQLAAALSDAAQPSGEMRS